MGRREYLTCPVIFYPRDLVTCYVASDVISSSGPEVYFRHAEEQILIFVHMPQPTLLEYLKTPFQSPFHRMTVDAIKVSTEK
jgi:hypothetical protein